MGAATLFGLAGLAAPAVALADLVEVQGVQVTGRGAPVIATAPTDTANAPQSVTIIGAEQLRAQGVSSLEQALRNVPGITVAIGEGGTLSGDQFRIRGFDAKDDIYIDGLRDFGAYSRDSFNDQAVEILRGPSGALFGRGTTGGAINIVSKSAHLGDATDLSAYAGNGEFGRVLVDVNRQVNDTTAVRLNLMGQSNGSVNRDHISGRRWGVAASVATGLGTNTRFTLNLVTQHANSRPDYGVIIVQRPGDLIAMPAPSYDVGVEPSTFLGYAADYDRSTASVLTARFAHAFSDGATVTSDARYGDFHRSFAYSTTDLCTAACNAALFDDNPATAPNAGMGGQGPYTQHSTGLQSLTALRFDARPMDIRTQWILGLDVVYQRSSRSVEAYTLPAAITVRNTIPRNLLDPDLFYPAGYAVYHPTPSALCPVAACSVTPTNPQYVTASSTDVGAFVTGRVWIAPQLSMIGTIRWDRYDAGVVNTLFDGQLQPFDTSVDFISPRVSVVWEPTRDLQLYVTWNQSATPPNTSIVGSAAPATTATADLDPEDSRSTELGLRYSFLNRRLTFQASAFQIDKDNARQTDPATGFILGATGERQRVRGYELQLTGSVVDWWTINAAYTHLESEILDSTLTCSATAIPCGAGPARPVTNTFIIGRPVAFIPPDSASLWTELEPPALRDWEFGFGLTYQSAFNTGYTVTTSNGITALSRIARIPDTFSVDGMVAYRIGRVRLALNGYNLTDRLNYGQVFSNRATPAPGRTIIASVGISY